MYVNTQLSTEGEEKQTADKSNFHFASVNSIETWHDPNS